LLEKITTGLKNKNDIKKLFSDLELIKYEEQVKQILDQAEEINR